MGYDARIFLVKQVPAESVSSIEMDPDYGYMRVEVPVFELHGFRSIQGWFAEYYSDKGNGGFGWYQIALEKDDLQRLVNAAQDSLANRPTAFWDATDNPWVKDCLEYIIEALTRAVAMMESDDWYYTCVFQSDW